MFLILKRGDTTLEKSNERVLLSGVFLTNPNGLRESQETLGSLSSATLSSSSYPLGHLSGPALGLIICISGDLYQDFSSSLLLGRCKSCEKAPLMCASREGFQVLGTPTVPQNAPERNPGDPSSGFSQGEFGEKPSGSGLTRRASLFLFIPPLLQGFSQWSRHRDQETETL